MKPHDDREVPVAIDLIKLDLALRREDPQLANRVQSIITGVWGADLAPNGRHLVVLSTVQPESVRWAWPGRIPLGKLTILDGDPGLGKSTLTLDLAARLSTGAPMPDGAISDLDGPAGVVLLTAEDGLGDTVRPRLDVAGADCSRIAALRLVQTEEGDRLPVVTDVPAIAAAVERVEAALIVVDPFVAYLGGDVNSHRDQDVRGALAGLAELADRLRVAVLAVRHLNKAAGTNPLYRGGGSIGLIAAARSGLLVARDPEDESGERRILAMTKCNLARPSPSLSFVLEQAGPTVRVHWQGATQHTASGLLSISDREERSALDEAKQFLIDELKVGPIAAKELQARARDAGVAWRTIRRAADELSVRKEKMGFASGWQWSLPEGGQGDWPPSGKGGMATFEKGQTGSGFPERPAHEDVQERERDTFDPQTDAFDDEDDEVAI